MAKDYNIEKFFPSAEYIVENAYIYAWECDIFLQMKSGYHYEIEKKISRSDFRADFKKEAKHFQFKNSKIELITIPGSKLIKYIYPDDFDKFDYDVSELIQGSFSGRNGHNHKLWLSSYVNFRKNIIPNRFFYLTPKGLLKKEEIPKYAGLLEYSEGETKQVKSAPFLHKNKYNFNKVLLDKYKFRNDNLKRELILIKRALKKFNDIYDNPEDLTYQSSINF